VDWNALNNTTSTLANRTLGIILIFNFIFILIL